MTRSLREPPKPPDGSDHRADYKAYGVIASGAAQRKAVWDRDSRLFWCGVEDDAPVRLIACACCKKLLIEDEFDAEHIYPLHLVDRSDYPTCLRRWSRANLEAVCRFECHKVKSARELKELAKAKRLAGETCTKPKGRKLVGRPFQKGVKRKIQSRGFAQQRGRG